MSSVREQLSGLFPGHHAYELIRPPRSPGRLAKFPSAGPMGKSDNEHPQFSRGNRILFGCSGPLSVQSKALSMHSATAAPRSETKYALTLEPPRGLFHAFSRQPLPQHQTKTYFFGGYALHWVCQHLPERLPRTPGPSSIITAYLIEFLFGGVAERCVDHGGAHTFCAAAQFFFPRGAVFLFESPITPLILLQDILRTKIQNFLRRIDAKRVYKNVVRGVQRGRVVRFFVLFVLIETTSTSHPLLPPW